jgi:hypothetical protein
MYMILLQESSLPTSHHFAQFEATPVCVGKAVLVVLGTSGNKGVDRVDGVPGMPMQYHEEVLRYLHVEPTLGFQAMNSVSEKEPKTRAMFAQSSPSPG